MERTRCVFCTGVLREFYTRKEFPISMSPIETDASIVSDQVFGSCVDCGCVQLMTLIDPDLLYNSNHNETYNTPTWKLHHESFARFILENSLGDRVIEIGGNPNILPRMLNHGNYSIMNMCAPENSSTDVLFILGNCETYVFDTSTDIIMSHVFEHLYNPSVFIRNAANRGVNKIFISIPNMDALLESGNPNCVTNEHTFFVNKSLIKTLFLKHGYVCEKSEDFKNHSYFFVFTKMSGELSTITPIQYGEYYLSRFTNILQGLETIQIDQQSADYEHTFIVPGGHYGQMVYYYFKPSRFQGFLDNDKSKQGKYVYGTGHKAFPFETLKNFMGKRTRVLLYSGPYTSEIRKQLENYEVDIIECRMSK